MTAIIVVLLFQLSLAPKTVWVNEAVRNGFFSGIALYTGEPIYVRLPGGRREFGMRSDGVVVWRQPPEDVRNPVKDAAHKVWTNLTAKLKPKEMQSPVQSGNLVYMTNITFTNWSFTNSTTKTIFLTWTNATIQF